ncbi:hypothetical protein RF11_12761 [Thelohanellus kitauei]|uniref:Uncharacterized protein n=1 Tax=Thelohanellus kitauei TaxID=669202 RepID=A0A0C2IWV3_THEKT|nr:hypothetical protein RF11_12761 [Thelohanellus kitauei]
MVPIFNKKVFKPSDLDELSISIFGEENLDLNLYPSEIKVKFGFRMNVNTNDKHDAEFLLIPWKPGLALLPTRFLMKIESIVFIYLFLVQGQHEPKCPFKLVRVPKGCFLSPDCLRTTCDQSFYKFSMLLNCKTHAVDVSLGDETVSVRAGESKTMPKLLLTIFVDFIEYGKFHLLSISSELKFCWKVSCRSKHYEVIVKSTIPHLCEGLIINNKVVRFLKSHNKSEFINFPKNQLEVDTIGYQLQSGLSLTSLLKIYEPPNNLTNNTIERRTRNPNMNSLFLNDLVTFQRIKFKNYPIQRQEKDLDSDPPKPIDVRPIIMICTGILLILFLVIYTVIGRQRYFKYLPVNNV